MLHTSGTNSTNKSRRAFSVELMPEHTLTRDGKALGATVLFPGGQEGAAVGIDPHFLPKVGARMEKERLAAEDGARSRL